MRTAFHKLNSSFSGLVCVPRKLFFYSFTCRQSWFLKTQGICTRYHIVIMLFLLSLYFCSLYYLFIYLFLIQAFKKIIEWMASGLIQILTVKP